MDDTWSNKKVLVTGAGGFIGSHLVEALVLRNANVRAMVHYNSRGDLGLLRYVPSDILEKVDIIGADLRDAYAVRSAVNDCEVVFHLGALISIPYSYVYPGDVAETNILGTMNVLLACRDLGVKRLVHTSTSEVYGTAQYAPIDEKHPLQAQSPYSGTKIAADKLVESFYRTYGMDVITVRPFNTYGPRQSARAVIPTIITQALARKTIYLGNLETIRDFTFVGDTVEGFIMASESDRVTGKTLNLGTGTEIKIGAIAQKIIELTGSTATVEIDPERFRPKDSEVFRLISDHSMMTELTGWRPLVSLDEGLSRTIEWISRHLNSYTIGKYMI
ncbi:MAG: GDP-mannose 4,6-dehydratase [Anaerolineaceae bacterium]|nr:GDP-mannose 4,6-dehydratase [Anaerolineaceae bacterium]